MTESYIETKRLAAEQVDELAIAHPDYFRQWAERIAAQCEQWHKTAEAVKPTPDARHANNYTCWTAKNPAAQGWKRDPDDEILEPSPPMYLETPIPGIHPVDHLLGTFDQNRKKMFVNVAHLSDDDRLAVYVAALLVLHDENPAYPPLTENVWPDGLRSNSCVFWVNPEHPDWTDKSDFIAAALRHVRADLDRQSTEQPKDLPSGKGDETIHLRPDEVDLLDWINENDPQISYIIKYSKRSANTNQKNSNTLKKYGFIEPPKGKKKGVCITKKGRSYLDTHF